MVEKTVLDNFDHKLLGIMRRNNQTPARELAKAIGLSESAVLRRLRRLRADKVIIGDVSIVSSEATGKPLSVYVLVALERENSRELDAFARKLKTRSEVTQASYVTGDADFVVQLRLSSMEEYDRFVQDVFHEDQNVKSFRTLVTIREIEVTPL